jgi:hypothetical protein
VEEQKAFIVAALQALNKLGVKDKEFVTEMMVQFLDGDKEVRYEKFRVFSDTIHVQ